MDFNLRSKTYGHIHFTPAVPASFAKWVIPGSQPYSARGKFGSILLQQIIIGGIHLFYTICDIREDLAIDFTINRPVWVTHIALENMSTFEINDTAVHQMKQGQFNLLHSSFSRGAFCMEQGKKYRTLSISYPAEQLRKLIPAFPFLNGFMNGAGPHPIPLQRRGDLADSDLLQNGEGEMVFLFKNHRWINSMIMDMADHLLGCLHRGSLRRFYFNVMVKELLFSLLSLEYAETVKGKIVDSHKAEAINEAKYILETSYGKPISLRKIAKQVGMDVKELKKELTSLLET
ncbi:MAG: hypothetical protein Q8941_18530 [Bacteroidota bacterium]|nr:hypothetical protein [Bacteroidota bacterium]